MPCASVRSTLGLALGGASWDSTAPNTGSTTSFAWQHGHVTLRFSPLRFPMGTLYAFRPKKQGHDISCLTVVRFEYRLGLGGIFTAGETGRGAQPAEASAAYPGAACLPSVVLPRWRQLLHDPATPAQCARACHDSSRGFS